MSVTRHTLFVILVLSLTVSIRGQKTEAPQQPQNNTDKYDDAHRTLFEQQQVDKAREAGQFADQVSRVLPQGEDHAGPVPRKNYVDEFIFSRVERDRIPHAGLSTD